MNVTKYQRKRLNENNQRIENNKELLSYPYLTVVRKTKIQGGGLKGPIPTPPVELMVRNWVQI
jgi:hypothetical protein